MGALHAPAHVQRQSSSDLGPRRCRRVLVTRPGNQGLWTPPGPTLSPDGGRATADPPALGAVRRPGGGTAPWLSEGQPWGTCPRAASASTAPAARNNAPMASHSTVTPG